MKSITRMFFLALAVLANAPLAFGQFSDGFESYAVGNLPPQGGWIDFGGSQPITVSTAQAHTGTKSMRLSEGTDTLGGTSSGYGSDVYKNFAAVGTISTGRYEFSYWQFMEQAVDSVAFNYITTGRLPTTFETGLDLRGDPINGSGVGANLAIVAQDVGGTLTLIGSAPLVVGRWVEHKVDVNLATNLYTYSYDGNAIVTGQQWDRTPGNGVTLGGINFWMQLGNTDGVNSAVYYDDFNLRLVPEPAMGLFAALGGLALAAFRRR